ncbi:TPA: Tn3 family transposase [Bacillus thuringiensis]|nr:Tn3 family transposase [Bacillus thuringiensis]
MLGRPTGEFGKIVKTQHNLLFITDWAYRRKILTQLNRGESRHSLARAVMYGEKESYIKVTVKDKTVRYVRSYC